MPQIEQANSENCGPPPGNKFELEVGQGQGHNMVPIEKKNHCSIINTSVDMSQVKVFVTDRRTDRRMSFNVPRFRERRGAITSAM